jgi:hypothetical protein
MLRDNSNRLKLNGKKRKREIIISLTTKASRLNRVWICIASLMDQSMKADRVILWLGNDLDDIKLPVQLIQLQKKGLEIRFCTDFKPHTKYYEAFKNYPDDIIITADDDIFYPRYFVKRLVEKHQDFSEDIICYRAHKITFTKSGSVKPYREWDQECDYEGSSHLLLATGVSGVLYQPKKFINDTLNEGVFTKLAPRCDDLWLKVMEIKSELKVRQVFPFALHFPMISNTQSDGLFHENVENNNNDIEMTNLLRYYENIDFNKLH